MSMKSFMSLAAVLLAGLAGCSPQGAPSASTVPQRPMASIPALPIIQESVFALAPTFGGRRSHDAMEQVCGLARGELRQEQVNAYLRSRNVDPSVLPRQGDSWALLVGGDKAAQSTACAAYLATTVLLPIDADTLIRMGMKSTAPAQRSNGEAGTPESSPAAPGETGRSLHWIEAENLALELRTRLAEARANADVFALIAAELQRRPGLSVDQYRELAQQMFGRLAPFYLERIRTRLPPPGVTYRLLSLNGERFAFRGSNDASFEFGADGLVLRQNGVVWYGQGKLLGNDYPLEVAYYPESVTALLAAIPEKILEK